MKRILYGFGMFFTAIGSILFGGLVFPLILGIVCYLGGCEFINMARAKGFKPSSRIIKGMIVAFFVVAALPEIPGVSLPWTYPLEHYPLLLTVGICMSFFRLLFRHETPPATIADIATTILGFIYVGFLPSHLVLLRNLTAPGLSHITNPLQQPGLAYVWVCLFIVWATDVFAYYAGKKFGKHLLYPQISPKKTIEGAVAGLLASVFWAIVVVYAADHFLFVNTEPFRGKIWHAPLMGLLVSIAAQLGDLCESLLKRDAGMKDSSDAIPGHGGFLDRGDSLLFASPVSYYWIWIVVLGHF
ncbi:MAG: phosphatidate cytidylyltransferase [Candidatus Melainabacteria bacterium]|nr:phosphatidate cytidylyltransferase [Candidatus Melainabacteria bacterium]